jgi:hypothetical protein
MRNSCLYFACLIFLASTLPASGQLGIYQRGSVVRMHMGDCLPDHGFVAAFSGNARPQAADVCPEYTLVGDKVVYVIVGRASKDVLPLAEEVDFRLRKNEIAVRVDDERHETRFSVREMILRGEWDRSMEKSTARRAHYGMPVIVDQ